MFDSLKAVYERLKEGKPGERFIRYYEKTKNKDKDHPVKKWLLIAGSALLALIGIIISLPPGIPGFFLWIPALGLLASRVRPVAVVLDKIEVGVRDVLQKIRQVIKQ